MLKKTFIKFGLCLGCVVLIVLLILEMVNLSSDNKINLTTTYIATHDISPRSCISEEDITEIKVPIEYLNSYVISHKDEIIGKYTDIQGKIPAGSLFYDSMLYSPEDMPDIPGAQLKDGQAILTLQKDSIELTNLVAGMRVDIVCDSEVIVNHARILVIEDHSGLSIENPDSSAIGYQILLAVNADDLSLLEKLKEEHGLSLRITSEAYSEEEATLNVSSILVSSYNEVTME